VAEARNKAERVRRDSERELTAATARRDSITAQLSNVRQMLATLGGASMVEGLVEEPKPEAASQPPKDEKAPQDKGGKAQGEKADQEKAEQPNKDKDAQQQPKDERTPQPKAQQKTDDKSPQQGQKQPSRA
jgi:hypothetical protein